MDKLFDSLKGFFKKPPVIIDNLAFRLHYRATFVVLVGFSLMITAKQYFGDPIDCISKDDIPGNLLDTYCWIHTTFSLENAFRKKVGHEVPYPGVDKSTPDEKRVYHAYYQWVCFVLFFQALFFYVPRKLWKAYENGRLAKLTAGLSSPLGDTKNEDQIRKLSHYLKIYEGRFNSYFYIYTACEILNLINVLVQMHLVDRFLGGEFSTYGWKVIQFTEWDSGARFDPMLKVFPRLTKCTFHRFGSSGDVQRHDAMCILPINILNEKIYVFIWFWFYMIAIVTFVAIVYRFATYFFKKLRVQRTQAHCRLAPRYELEDLIGRTSVGDWFMLDLLSKNIDPINFSMLITRYGKTDEAKA